MAISFDQVSHTSVRSPKNSRAGSTSDGAATGGTAGGRRAADPPADPDDRDPPGWGPEQEQGKDLRVRGCRWLAPPARPGRPRQRARAHTARTGCRSLSLHAITDSYRRVKNCPIPLWKVWKIAIRVPSTGFRHGLVGLGALWKVWRMFFQSYARTHAHARPRTRRRGRPPDHLPHPPHGAQPLAILQVSRGRYADSDPPPPSTGPPSSSTTDGSAAR